MKFLKNNLKVIIAFILGLILAGGIVYAATSAKDINYTTAKNTDIKNVEDALNDLYSKNTFKDISLIENKEVKLLNSQNNQLIFNNLTCGKYLLYVLRTATISDNGYYAMDASSASKIYNSDTIKNGIPSISIDNGNATKISDNIYIINIIHNSSAININSNSVGSSNSQGGYLYSSLYSIN